MDYDCRYEFSKEPKFKGRMCQGTCKDLVYPRCTCKAVQIYSFSLFPVYAPEGIVLGPWE